MTKQPVPSIPPSAASVRLADLQATGTLTFHDGEGCIVHAMSVTFNPVFHPHTENLAAAIAAVIAEIEGQLVPPPAPIPPAKPPKK